MDRLEAMQVFVAVAEQASFAAGARKLSLSAARVTRAVSGLEQHIGARLLHRTTRVVRLTEAGASYLVHCKRILGDLEEAESLAASAHGQLVGQLTITAPVIFGRLCVTPVILGFLKRHPRVGVRAVFSDQVLDLLDQNIDVAVRIAHLPDSSFSAVRVGAVRRVVCASPAYLRAHGVPARPSDLQQHELVVFSGLGAPAEWSFWVGGRSESFTPRSRLNANSGDLAIAAALAGHGLTRVLSYQIAEEVRAKRLRIVLSEFELPPVPVHLVHREGRATSGRVRAFVDQAVEELRAALRSER
jgi:DNA-binding transcriptional LysR family regulator